MPSKGWWSSTAKRKRRGCAIRRRYRPSVACRERERWGCGGAGGGRPVRPRQVRARVPPRGLHRTARRPSRSGSTRRPPNVPGGEGFWVLSRYADVAGRRIGRARRSRRYGRRPRRGRHADRGPADRVRRASLLNMTDDPCHQRFRSLLTPSVTPRASRRSRTTCATGPARSSTPRSTRRQVDLLVDVAAELPLQAAAALLGVPQEDRPLLIEWADATLDYDDRELGGSSERAAAASAAMFEYGDELIARVATILVEDLLPRRARDGARRWHAATAATRRAAAAVLAPGRGGHRDHAQHDRRRCGGAGPPRGRLDRTRRGPVARARTAVEEMLRWTSSTTYNRRTATRDVSVGDRRIRAGDKVTLWWASANRDERVFVEPFRFDIRRAPNRHLAFGHGGHFCLGAALARLEIRVVLEELLERVAVVRPTGRSSGPAPTSTPASDTSRWSWFRAEPAGLPCGHVRARDDRRGRPARRPPE